MLSSTLLTESRQALGGKEKAGIYISYVWGNAIAPKNGKILALLTSAVNLLYCHLGLLQAAANQQQEYSREKWLSTQVGSFLCI
jgi:hypothetical protein